MEDASSGLVEGVALLGETCCSVRGGDLASTGIVEGLIFVGETCCLMSGGLASSDICAILQYAVAHSTLQKRMLRNAPLMGTSMLCTKIANIITPKLVTKEARIQRTNEAIEDILRMCSWFIARMMCARWVLRYSTVIGNCR